MLLTLPALTALLGVSWPIVAVLFLRGEFSVADARATADALAAFSLGLPAYVLIKVFTPSFFAREDTATPVKVAGVAMLVNIVAMLALMGPLKHVGIALATALSAWVNAGLLAWLLRRRHALPFDARLKQRVPRIAVASAVTGGLLHLTLTTWPQVWTAPLWQKGSALAGLVVAGMAVFAVLVVALGGTSLGDIRGFVRRKEV